MDMLISKKFQELDEAGVGSSKDIADLLALSHKMTMEQLDREIQLEKVRGSNIKSQVNVQINDGGATGSNYGSLLEKLLKSNA
jgi:molybdenum cofactor biosynthesis enzyme